MNKKSKWKIIENTPKYPDGGNVYIPKIDTLDGSNEGKIRYYDNKTNRNITIDTNHKKISLDEFRPNFTNSNDNIQTKQISNSEINKRKEEVDPRKNTSPITQKLVQANPQSKGSKAWEIISHPMTAITNLNKTGNIPDYFSKGSTNPLDYAVDIVNPAFYMNAAGRTIKNLVNPETYTDIPKALGSAAINLTGEDAYPEWNDAALRTLGKTGDALASLPVAGVTALGGIKGFTQVAKRSPAVREMIYKGIDPLGYGAREKIINFVPNLVKYSMNPEAKLNGTVEQFIKNGALKPTAERFAKNRMDAWRLGLNLDQKYDTFSKIGENKYTFNPGVMQPGRTDLADIYGDALAHIITKGKSNNKFAKYSEAEFNLLQDLNRSMMIKKGDYPADNVFPDYFPKYKPTQLVDNFNKDFTRSVYDADRYTGTMGAFRWDLKHTSDGLHYQVNDRWDLHPFAERGPHNHKSLSANRKEHFYDKLKDVEMLDVLGGKPYDIQTNFLVDPKNYRILKQFKNGGRSSKWQLISN